MTSPLPETAAPTRPDLPAAQIALEAYWQIGRHFRTYAGQVLVLSAIIWFVHFATSSATYVATATASAGAQVAALQLAYIVSIVAVLVLGGTAIFIGCQRAIVLDKPPAVNQALRLQPGEVRVLRQVCIYWLIVHLVPTVVVHLGYLAEPLDLSWFSKLPIPAGFAFYWGWVLATAPLVVLSLPIVLFEATPTPIAEGRRRLDGNTGRLFMASVIAFLPLAIIDVALYVARDLWGPLDDRPGLQLLLDGVLVSILRSASSLTTILVMSALVASAYVRLSPRLDSVYRVFD